LASLRSSLSLWQLSSAVISVTLLPQPLKDLVQMLILKAGQVVANSGTDLQVTVKIAGFTNSLYENTRALLVSIVFFHGTGIQSISMPFVVSLIPVSSNSNLWHCALAFWHEHHSDVLLNKCWLLYAGLSQSGFKKLKHKNVLKKKKKDWKEP